MLEEFFYSVWEKIANPTLVTYQTKDNPYIKQIDLTKDCITIYGNADASSNLVRLSDGQYVGIWAYSAHLAYPFFKNNPNFEETKLKKYVEFMNKYIASNPKPDINITHNDQIIAINQGSFSGKSECSKVNLMLTQLNLMLKPNSFSHLCFWHQGKKHPDTLPHSHAISPTGEPFELEQVKILLDQIKFFNQEKFTQSPYLNDKDVKNIVALYEEELNKLKNNNKILATDTKNYFFYTCLSTFFINITSRYILPALLYHRETILGVECQKILSLLSMAKYIIPVFQLINVAINFEANLTNFLLKVLSLIVSYLTKNYVPFEISSIVSLITCMAKFDVNQDVNLASAQSLGIELGYLAGSTSAKALGTLLSNTLIKYLPKLKLEPKDNPDKTLENLNVIQHSKGVNKDSNVHRRKFNI